MSRKVLLGNLVPDDVVAAAIEAGAHMVGQVRISGTDSETIEHAGQIVGKLAKAIIAELQRGN